MGEASGNQIRTKANKEAEKLYDVDFLQIILNGTIAFITSTVASVATYLATGVDPVTAGLVFAATFVPTFTAKVITEYAKKRAVMKAARRAYKQGRFDAELMELDNGNHILRIRECFWARVYSLFNPFCFLPSSPQFFVPTDSLFSDQL